ncbi:unnamed protein product [Linum tenue]|uniref:Uncharacterized protein n=1 Tax=Linum tenue TaxID=586396 RepID=A0AAV0IQM8_9ROSI|nr:unnamed protein product [Linum tenue]
MAFRVLVLLLLSSLLAHSIGFGVAKSVPVVPAIPDHNPCLDLKEYHYRPSEELPYGRWSFPDGFVFGSATAAYQVEGAANQYCRGPSIWDRFAHEFPERIADGSNGDVALDHYHRLEEDIVRMKYMNLDAYRFSISWTRIIPFGPIKTGINEQGVKFYHDLLDLLEKHGLEPYVTIWHWDTPQALEAEYGGFLSRNILKDYEDYCDFLFKEYGHRIKTWITLNEPMVHIQRGYDEGLFAPGRCSVWVNRACVAGDSATEPYIVAHNLLLAHAAAYRLYETKYKAKQQGVVGITLVTFMYLPYDSNSTADIDAAQRSLDFNSQVGSFWQFLYPDGLRLLLEYTKDTYGDHDIYITENGMGTQEDPTLTLAEVRNDTMRVNFYNAHLASVRQAMIEKDVKVRGFFAWSYADNYEWNDGYSVRFGLNYVNYTDLSRWPKYSACWYTGFCRRAQPKIPSDNNLQQLITSGYSPAVGRKTLFRRPAAYGVISVSTTTE